MPDLRVLVQRRDPRREATVAFVLGALGVTYDVASADAGVDGPHLVLGDGEARPDRIVIPVRPGDVIWSELLRGEVDPRSLGGVIPFDVIGAIGAFLDDRVDGNPGPDAIDVHLRLRWAASAAVRAGFGEQPIVNRYIALLEELLRTRIGIAPRARWPGGRKAAIGLSHDVDLPDRYALLGSAIRPWRFRGAPRTYVRRTADLVRRGVRDRHPHDFWAFDRLARSEADRGFRSTFFFATVPFHHAAGAAEDVAYDVRGGRYRAAIRALTDAGFDIGLHASYRAFEDPERFAAERQTLADLADVEIDGLRHHYWHLGPDVAATLRAHERAGFTYDSSIAFNDHVGFRRGVAMPFHPWDAELERPLRVLQLPTFCMDGNLFYASDDVDAAVATVDRAIDAIVATGGMGSIDWHIQTSYPSNDEFRAWGIAYQQILSRLADRPDVWTTDLGSIARWATGRDRALAAGSNAAALVAAPDRAFLAGAPR